MEYRSGIGIKMQRCAVCEAVLRDIRSLLDHHLCLVDSVWDLFHQDMDRDLGVHCLLAGPL